MARYAWVPGSRIGVNAQVAGERLAAITVANDGSLTPAAVVDDARPPDSPLHPAFTWDDKVAAEKYRHVEARQLIRSVRVLETGEDGKVKPILQYVSVSASEEGRSYMTTARVFTDEELQERALQDALKALEGWRRRYEHLNELAPIFAAIERARMASLRRRPRSQPKPTAVRP